MIHINLKAHCLVIILIFISGALSENAYAWFNYYSGYGGVPVFEDTRGDDRFPGSYIVSPNRPDNDNALLERLTSEDRSKAKAAEINIDIPFNLLAKTVINPQSLLDRQIAANLEVQNLLAEYQAMKKRNAELIKELNIPYLDRDSKEKKKNLMSIAEKIEPALELKQKMAEVITFQQSRSQNLAAQENPELQAVWYGKKRTSVGSGGKAPLSGNGASYGAGGTGRHTTTMGQDTELPWIFSVILELFRYVVSNKFDILAWLSVLVVSGGIGMLVAKR